MIPKRRCSLDAWRVWVERGLLSAEIRSSPTVLRRARLLLWFTLVTFSSGLAMFGVAAYTADGLPPVLMLNLGAFILTCSSAILLRWATTTFIPSLISSFGVSVVLGCGIFLGGGLHNTGLLFFAILPLFYSFAGGLIPAVTSAVVLLSIVTGFYVLELNSYPFIEVVPQSDALAYICVSWAVISSLGLARFNDRLTRDYLHQLEIELVQRKSIETSLRDSEAKKDEFLAYLGHEIRNPMASILAAADMLAMPEFTEKRGHYISVLRRSANSLRDLLDHVLDFSMIESGNIVLHHYSFSLGELVTELREEFEIQATGKGLAFVLSVDDSLPEEVVADRVRLRQILFNLLGNAVKYTEVGRVELLVAAEKDSIRFGVKDTGVGISPELHLEVFKPYVQASLPVRGRGIGLGLPISAQLVALMGGELRVDSDPRGSLFEFNLTLVRTPAQLPTWRERLNSKSVLVVDDNDAFRDILSEMLASQGFHVSTAVDGEEAIELCRKLELDLIIMDLNMPVKDGFQASKQIRLDEERSCVSRVKILAVTGNQSAGLERRCKESGVDLVLRKPVSSGALEVAVTSLLDADAA